MTLAFVSDIMYRLSFEEDDFSGGAGGFSAAVATATPLIKKIDNCIANREVFSLKSRREPRKRGEEAKERKDEYERQK